MRPQSRHFLAAFALVLLLVLVWNWRKQEHSTEPPSPTQPQSRLAPAIQKPLFLPIVRSNTIDSTCLKEAKAWLALDLNRFSKFQDSKLKIRIEDPITFAQEIAKLRPLKRCDSYHDPVLSGFYQDLRKSCLLDKKDLKSFTDRELMSCLRGVLDFRMIVIDRSTANLNLANIQNEQILTQKMLAALFAPTSMDELTNLIKVEKVASRLLEVNPEHREAALYLAKSQLRQQELTQSENLESLSRSMEKVEKLSPDVEGAALQFRLARLQKDFDRMEDISYQLSSTGDAITRSMGYYFLAWSQSEEGKSGKALASLRKAVAVDSGNGLAKEALIALRDSKKTSDRGPFYDISQGFTGISIIGPPH